MIKEQINQTINQLVLFLMFQKYLEDVFIVNHIIALIKIFFSKHQCGFHKGFNTQYVLLFIIEKIKIADDNKNFVLLISQIYQKLLTVFVMTYPGKLLFKKIASRKITSWKNTQEKVPPEKLLYYFLFVADIVS